MVHDRDPVAEDLGLVHVVRGQHHRAAGVVEPGEQVPQVAAGLRVERRGRLVEEDHLGVVDERGSDREPLRLAAGQVLDPGVGLVLQPHPRQPLVRGLPADAVQRGEGVDLLARGQPLEERRRLELDADPRQQRGVARPDRLAQHRDRARVGPAQPLDGLEGRRLPGAVGAEDPDELALADLEADAVDGPQVAVGHGEVDDLDRPSGHPRDVTEPPQPVEHQASGQVTQVDHVPVASRSLLSARLWACPAWMSLTHSQPGLADGPIRGSSGSRPSRRACTYARSCSIRART